MSLGRQNNLDFLIGEKLASLYQTVGLTIEEYQFYQSVLLTPTERSLLYLLARESGDSFVKAQLISQDNMEKLTIDLQQLISAEDTTLMYILMGQIVGRVP